MTLAALSEKSTIQNDAIIEKELENITNHNQINKNQMDKKEWTVVAALLGINSEKATEESVTSCINDMKNRIGKLDSVNAELENTKKQLSAANTELSGAKATISNLQSDLEKVKNSLKAYQDAEEAARKESIVKMVDDAISNCKINKDSKEDWLKMAENDFETTKKVLDAIPSREKISNAIATDETNKKEAKDGMKSQEAEIKAKVEQVVGSDFKFRKI